MKRYILTLVACTVVSLLRAAETPTEKKEDQKESPAFEVAQVSEAFGHLIGKNLQNIGMKFDVAQVVKGLQDSLAGKESPMSEMECIQALTAAQEKAFKEQSHDNLKKAEGFLQDNAKTAGITSLENGKVQFRIDQEGKGTPLESHYSPLIRYTGKFLDGTVFSASKEEEKICLEEVIPGLRAGLIGMKEGERRVVYIHPDFAYGTSGCLPPNALLTFEVELVQANAPSVEENTELKTEQEEGKKSTSELADSETHVR